MIYDEPKELGRRISAARAYAGLGMDDLADRLGISTPTLRRWVNGEERSLGTTTQERRLKAELVREVTGCPTSFFDESTSVPNPDRLSADVERLMKQMDYVLAMIGATQLQRQDLPEPAGDQSTTSPKPAKAN